jgi:hypothetical protein
MEQLAGVGSRFEWFGTFFAILTPGVLVGAALGASSAAGHEHRALLRWTAASPLLFALFTLTLPGVLVALVTTGIGGGAVGVPLAAVVGGYALGGCRPWLRILATIGALVALGGLVSTVPLVAGLPLDSPQGAWLGVFIASLITVGMLAASIPFARQRVAAGVSSPPPSR